MVSFFFCLVVGVTSVFIRLNHPLSMGAMILLLSGLSSILIGMEVSSWFGYVIFLIYVGALLVMFAYVAALAPNPEFKLSFLFFVFMVGIIVFCYLISLVYWPFSESQVLNLVGFIYGNSNVQSSMASSDGSFVLVGLGVLLLLVLVVVCKICRFYKGPLRLF
uniref:NADH-ubiquinone oxidoreductase chain 6 n=1 Tax=Myadora brevis TaxID=457650 RepID=A0A1U9XPJ1_9BIVA|nr:NADH dehydrogenase subunit 6 [Myadora brevis]AQZ26166.1 NADH dehydrogenase subunit 6 [Myadora brevis]